jgi:hypothetical protein
MASILDGAEDAQLQHSTFNLVEGNQYDEEFEDDIPFASDLTQSSEEASLSDQIELEPTHILKEAVNSDVKYSVFNSVKGHQFSSPAAGRSMSTTPAKRQGERKQLHILYKAKRTDARFSVFNLVGGHQFGIPQAQRDANREELMDPSIC